MSFSVESARGFGQNNQYDNEVDAKQQEAPQPKEGCCGCFPRFSASVRRNPQYARFDRNLPVVVNGAEVGSRAAQSRELLLIFQGFTGSQGVSGNGWIENPGLISALGKARFTFGAIGIISAIIRIAAEVIEIGDEVKKNKERLPTDPASHRMRERNDALYRMFEAISSLGDSVASFGKSLSMAGWVDQAVTLNWAAPLAYVSALLSTVTIVVNARGLRASRENLQKLQQGTVEHSLEWLAIELEAKRQDGEYFMQRHFEIPNREKYGAQTLHIIREGTDTDKSELLEALKGRVTDKIKSHKLAILSALVGLLATVILFFPSIGPLLGMSAAAFAGVGLGFAITSGLISMIRYIKTKQSIKRLEDELNRIKPFEDIPLQWVKAHAPFAIPCLPAHLQELPKVTVEANHSQPPIMQPALVQP